MTLKLFAAAVLLLGTPMGVCATVADSAPVVAAAPAVRTVSIAAAQGQAGALLVTPAGSGPWPAVILYPDASGLRPEYGELAALIAQAGYVVLVPNQFYRSVALDGTAATAAAPLPAAVAMQRGMGWRQLATDDAVIADARAFAAFLDAQAAVNTRAPMAMMGTDVGAAHAFIAARALPERVAAVAVASPSAIATTRDTSPHLFVNQSRAAYLVEIAGPDDAREPEDKGDLAQAFSGAGLTGQVSVVPAAHGYLLGDAAARDAFLVAALTLFDDRLK